LPSSGLRRMLSPASLVTRILSTVGLKSKPMFPLFDASGAASNAGPSATAIAVATLTSMRWDEPTSQPTPGMARSGAL